MDTEEELIRKKNRALYALQELLSHAKNNRPSRLDEISKIEKASESVEDRRDYVRKFEFLVQLLDGFISEVNSEPPNPSDDWLNRLVSIRNAIIQYKNAYANYAINFNEPR